MAREVNFKMDKEMKTIINFMFSGLPIVKKLDGYKTYIGLAILALQFIVEFLAVAGQSVPALAGVATALKTFLDLVKPYVDAAGWSLLTVGAVHSKVKEVK